MSERMFILALVLGPSVLFGLLGLAFSALAPGGCS